MDEVLDIAQRVGLYVIARPSPCINGELDAGGFPGWLLTQARRAPMRPITWPPWTSG